MKSSFENNSLNYLSYLRTTKNLSDNSIRAYTHDLGIFRSYLETGNLSFENLDSKKVRAFVGTLGKKKLKESSINRIISSIKSFYKYCIRYDILDINPFSHVRSLSNSRKIPDVLSFAEISKMIEFADNSYLGIRDKVILEMLYSTGCRVSELTELKVRNVDLIKRMALVSGKGVKERWVFLTRGTADELSSYLPLRKKYFNDSGKQENGNLVLNSNGKSISTRGVRYIIDKYIKATGVTKHVSPHTFRHTFATHMLNNGAGIRIVQDMLGHSSISTTQVYTHVGMDRLKDVYRVAHPHGQ
ncbi:MAG: tyrosine-type recombinase/integrase [Spirochaetia bacterium]|jgi:integrase/recombinase XerC|nr:tyrosine-type recombinase/integrase [Spirochaetia bacterium]